MKSSMIGTLLVATILTGIPGAVAAGKPLKIIGGIGKGFAEALLELMKAE